MAGLARSLRPFRRGDQQRAGAIGLQAAIDDMERLGDPGRAVIILDRHRPAAHLGARIVLRVGTDRRRHRRKILVGGAVLDHVAAAQQGEMLRRHGDAGRVEELRFGIGMHAVIGQQAAELRAAIALARSALQRAIDQHVIGLAGRDRHRRLQHRAAGHVAARGEVGEVIEMRQAEIGRHHRGGDQNRRG